MARSKEKKFVWLTAVVFVVLLLGLVATAVAAAAGQQHWKLDTETTAAGYQMERVEGLGDDGQSGTVPIAPDQCVIWTADEAAQVDVTFSEGKWIVSLCTDQDWSADCDTYVGEWDGSSFTAFNTVTVVNYGFTNGIIRIESQLGSETIWQNNYLALQICNLSTDTTYSVLTEGCSELTSPCEDPGYPFPEIAAGVLFGIGLIGLLGYIGVRRVRAKKAAA